ncbi:hypothetical protein E2C01_030788 [Portunus trituberculatus]|uniref:Uncharacterized protein n=1 Tax=Portunus trituberculatus TaxID=210409 RepID=A0A5B7EYB8_PORTR|nr:hypothetical protein [Portunus trituberculatus]
MTSGYQSYGKCTVEGDREQRTEDWELVFSLIAEKLLRCLVHVFYIAPPSLLLRLGHIERVFQNLLLLWGEGEARVAVLDGVRGTCLLHHPAVGFIVARGKVVVRWLLVAVVAVAHLLHGAETLVLSPSTPASGLRLGGGPVGGMGWLKREGAVTFLAVKIREN